jgi:hypothetical protein
LTVASQRSAQPGDIVTFGNYPQSATGADRAPLRWRVLQNSGSELFVMSERIIDCKRYHGEFVDTTWRDCDLRKWLNEEFLEVAFAASPATPFSVAGHYCHGRYLDVYYSFILPSPDCRTVVLIAVVAGKGTSAAFYMAERKWLMLSLSRHHLSNPDALSELTRLFTVARSLPVQRAIAGVLIRADREALPRIDLPGLLPQHRIRSADGADVIDVLIRRLSA